MSQENAPLSASESARLLGISEAYIRKLIKLKEISATKKGRTWCIPREEIERFRTESHFNRTVESNRFALDSTDMSHELDVLKERLTAYERENHQLHEQVKQMESQLNHAETQNDHLTQVLAVAQKSISQLTEQNQFLLEDTRQQKSSWWRRIVRK